MTAPVRGRFRWAAPTGRGITHTGCITPTGSEPTASGAVGCSEPGACAPVESVVTGPDRDKCAGRPTDRRLLSAMAIVGLAVLVFLAISFAINPAVGVDDWGERRDPTGQPWRTLAELLGTVGAAPMAGLIVLAGIGWCIVLHRPRDGVLVAVGSISAPVSTEILKPLVGRRIHQHWLSFPSGHVAFATGLALACAVVLARARGWDRWRSRWAVPGIALAAGAPVGWAMVALNRHYVTDTLGGAATAFAVVSSVAIGVGRAGGSAGGRTDPATRSIRRKEACAVGRRHRRRESAAGPPRHRPMPASAQPDGSESSVSGNRFVNSGRQRGRAPAPAGRPVGRTI